MWAYGLLAGGIVAGLLAVLLVLRERRLPAVATRPRGPHADLYAHATAFVLVNGFLWVQDLVIGGGLDYAHWITIPWGVGLAVHAIVEFAHQTRRPLPH